jgi:hypothetical protein
MERFLVAGRRHPWRAERGSSRGLSRLAACAFAGWTVIAGTLAGCAPSAEAPINRPIEAMDMPWGPFARQCARTQISHDMVRGRGWQTVQDVYETCAGFSAMPLGQGSAEITASVGAVNQPSSTVILRMLRKTGGAARAAAPGDLGLLAQGSDSPEAAETLARDIGLTARQLIGPHDTLALPVRLSIPFPLDSTLSCHPDGGHRDRGRDTLVLSCTTDQTIRTDRVDAQVRLAGVEEIDIETGVRLSSLLAGHLIGRIRPDDNAAWRSANDRVLYRRDTEFE